MTAVVLHLAIQFYSHRTRSTRMRPLMKTGPAESLPGMDPLDLRLGWAGGRHAGRNLAATTGPFWFGPVDGGMFVVVARPPGAWWEGPFAGDGRALTE